MGISFSIPCDPCINKISHWIDEKVASTQNLEKNLAALETSMEELKAKQVDLLRRVTREEDRGLQRLAEFQVWLTRVENIKNEVNDLLVARTVQLQKLCLCGFCCKSPLSSYRYGKIVFLTLRKVEKLKSQVFNVTAEQAQISEVQERSLQPIIVGQDTMLDKAWSHLMEAGVGIMGMYGLGGVGKTTLLKQINNKFIKERFGFDFVIWVVVSKELNSEKIREEIARQVRLVGEEWKQKEESQKIDAIFNFLRKKKFVLLLDDIWEKVDIDDIGIPFPTKQNGCKVVFTTRSQAVCTHMGVEDPMEVQCLGKNEAFDLFQKKVGKITLGSDPEILNLARIVAKKCCGLPLALNVIGETMSCKRTIQEWRQAIDVLTSYAAKFYGMEDKILLVLKYSYDNLKGEHVKSCLLYCALFPDDDKIPKEKLVDYWICEGIIDVSRGIERAVNKGYEILGNLVCASLLMEGVDKWGRECVCMHDVIREMALWIATDHLGIEKESFIVHASVGLDQVPNVENWNVVRRMSLMKNKIRHLVGKPECLQLTTLLLQETNLANISSEFFKSMPKLVVLDLSGNRDLRVLPAEISELFSLQYLNLAKTGIRHLPIGLEKLKELIHLDLRDTTNLESIAGISSLHSLKVLKLTRSSFTWNLSIVEELESLEHIEVLNLAIDGPLALEKFLSSRRLTSCTRSLKIWDINMKLSGIVFLVTMEKLCRLVVGYSSISEIKMVSPQHNMKNLSTVSIDHCKGLKELTLLMFFPNLKDLTVSNADQVEDIIKKEQTSEREESGIVPFPKLIYLRLHDLPKLKNIYWSPLPVPCLKEIFVTKCPNLKKLPLDSKSGMHGENGLRISYQDKEWIEGVEWEDEATKLHFLSSCEQVSVKRILLQTLRTGESSATILQQLLRTREESNNSHEENSSPRHIISSIINSFDNTYGSIL